MIKRLTSKSIDALPPATVKRYEVRDALMPGLHLRVATTDRKVFYVSKRIDGKMKRIKIGAYPIVSLREAREQARTILRDIELGRYGDGASTEDEKPLPTLGDVIPQFIELYAKPRNRDWKNTERVLPKFSSLNAKPIDEIKRADVVCALDTIIAGGAPIRANRALAAIKRLMNWCVDRGMIETSPVTGLRPPTKEYARERVLSDDELIACWHGAVDEGFPFAQFTQLLILTGQRRGEVAGMRWSELDLENATWSLPRERVKNKKSHIIPLAPLTISILKSVPRFLNSELVFTTTGKTPISGFGRLKKRLDVVVGHEAEDWRFHDIRRTVTTNMAADGIHPHVIEAVLNHKSGVVSGVAAVYNRYLYMSEKREALEKWATKIAAMTKEPKLPQQLQKPGFKISGSLPKTPLTSAGI